MAYNIKLLRTAKGLTTQELSDECNLVTNKISHIEQERRLNLLPEEIQTIAKYFGISTTELIDKRATVIFL
jgi:transcriptional regulator with XRE-family HTH domain